MQDNENVNIIIITHNDSKTIKRTLESVTKGIRPANQIIVGDNDSTDNTYEIICDLVGAKPVTIDDKTGLPPQFNGKFNEISVKIFRKKSSPPGHSINMAMQMKWQGITIFGFMGKGSWYAPDKILQAISVFSEHQHVACVVSDFYNHHSDDKVERVFRCSFDTQQFLAHFPYDRNFLIRPQVFQKLKSGFNDQMSVREDYDLMLRVSEIGLIYHIPMPLHHNTISNIDESTKQSISQCEDVARQMAAQRRGQPGG